MYIDGERSWFLHGDQHSGRTDGGISPGMTVGVLLDLNKNTIRFYVNEEMQVRPPDFKTWSNLIF